jgi:hypothetical protein
MTIATFAKLTVAAAGLSIAALAGAGAASAGSADIGFLNELDEIGIIYPSADDVISDAHVVCNKLDGGADPDDILASFREYQPDLSAKSSKAFLVASARAYCPEYLA